ncbi:MAG: TolC family protein [Fibrobacteria bacterium]
MKSSLTIACAMLWAGVPFAQTGKDAAQNPVGKAPDSLSLEQALRSASKSHPGLEAHHRAVAAREGALWQASRGMIPEITLDIEDVAGSGSHQGFSAAQTTVQISQTLEWQGKRGRRAQVAAAEKSLAERDLEVKRLKIRALTLGKFTEALYAQRRLSLAVESQALSERLLEAVTRRVGEGAASMADQLRAHLAASEAGMEVRQDNLRLASAKRTLGLMMGRGEPGDLPPLRDGLDSLRALPALDDLQRNIGAGPMAASQSMRIRLAEAKRDQQQGMAGPDLTFSAGVRHMAEPGDVALVGGISMPLPFLPFLALRNRNGSREEARQEVAQAKAEHGETVLELKSGIGDIHKNLSLAREEIKTLREEVIPDALNAATVLETGYRKGRFGMLEVLNAETDLFRYRLRYLEGLLQYQLGYAELDRLIGSGKED